MENNHTEMAVLAALLIDPEIARSHATGLLGIHFQDPRNRRIFKTLMSRIMLGIGSDYISIVKQFHKEDVLDLLGGAEYLVELYTYLPNANEGVRYINALLVAHARREEVKKCLKEAREKLAIEKAKK